MKARSYQMTTRAASAQDTADRLIDAMLARFRTTPYPSLRLDDVARDAGVTVQTAIRRYGTKEQLLAATARREVERISAARARPAFADPATAVSALCEYYEADGDLIARFEAEAALVPTLAELARGGRAVHIRWIEEVFAARLGDDRELRLAQLVAILDVRTWQVLRRERGLSRDDTRRALEGLVASVG